MQVWGKDILLNLGETARIWRDAYVSQAWNEYPYAKPLSLTIAAMDAAAIGLYSIRDPMSSKSLKGITTDIVLGSIIISNILTLLVSLGAFVLRYLSVRNERLIARARQTMIDDSKKDLSESNDPSNTERKLFIHEMPFDYSPSRSIGTYGYGYIPEDLSTRILSTYNEEESKDEHEELTKRPLGSVPLRINTFYADKIRTVPDISMHLKREEKSKREGKAKKLSRKEETKRMLKFKWDVVKDTEASYTLRFLNDGQEMYRMFVPFQQIVLLKFISRNWELLFSLIIRSNNHRLETFIDHYKEYFKKLFFKFHCFSFYWNEKGEICENLYCKEEEGFKFNTLMAYFNTEDFKNFCQSLIWYNMLIKQSFSMDFLLRINGDSKGFYLNVGTEASRYFMRVVSNEEIFQVSNTLRLIKLTLSFGSKIMGQMYYDERPAELDSLNALRTMLDTTFPDRLNTGFRSRMLKKVRVVGKEVEDGEKIGLLESVPLTYKEIEYKVCRGNKEFLARIYKNNANTNDEKVLARRQKTEDAGRLKMQKNNGILKNNLSHGMMANCNYDIVFMIRFFSKKVDTGKVYDLDLKISLPVEQIEFIDRIFELYYKPFIFEVLHISNKKPKFKHPYFFGENNCIYGEARQEFYSRNVKLNYFPSLKSEEQFAIDHLFNFKGEKKYLNGRSILNYKAPEYMDESCFKFYIDIDTSSRKSYSDDTMILESHLIGLSEVIRNRFVKFKNEDDRCTWLKYIDPLYQILDFKLKSKVERFFNSRDFWAPHRESLGITDCSQFEALPYYEDMDRKKVRSIKEEREQKNDDQPVAQHAGEKMRGWDQQVERFLSEPFCSGIGAERMVLIDISFGQKIDPTHCIMQYQHALLLKTLLDYSTDYLQGKSREDFTYGGYNDRFCPYVNYDPYKRKLLNYINEKYLDTYAKEIDTGRTKNKSTKYPFLIRLLGEPNLPEVGDRRLHYPVERHNGLRTTLEESKYLIAQIHGAIEVLNVISLYRYVKIERDTKKLLCLLNDIPYSIRSLILSTFKKSIESGMLKRIYFDNMLNLNVVDRENESHYRILMERMDVLDTINRLIVRNFSSSLVFEEERISKTKSQYMKYFRLIQEYYPKVLDSFKTKMTDYSVTSKDVSVRTSFISYVERGWGVSRKSTQNNTDLIASKDASVRTSFISYVERGGEVHRIGSLKKHRLHPGTTGKELSMNVLRNTGDQSLYSNNKNIIFTRIRPFESRFKILEKSWIANHTEDSEFNEFMQLMDLTREDLFDIKYYRNLIDTIELPTNDPIEINAMRRYELMALQLEEDINMLSHYEHQIESTNYLTF